LKFKVLALAIGLYNPTAMPEKKTALSAADLKKKVAETAANAAHMKAAGERPIAALEFSIEHRVGPQARP